MHEEKPLFDTSPSKFKQEFFVPLEIKEFVAHVSSDPDKDLFGAPKTRAAPSGFVSMDMENTIPNPKKMNLKDREALEVPRKL